MTWQVERGERNQWKKRPEKGLLDIVEKAIRFVCLLV